MPGIRKENEVGVISVDRVYASDFQKEGTLTAQLRQLVTVTSYYPSKKVSNEMNDSLHSEDEFGFEEQEFFSEETRIAWILVPTGTKLKDVNVLLKKHTAAVLYKVLSNKPILTEDQIYAIGQGTTTKAKIASSQLARFPELDDDGNPHPTANQLITDTNGNVQYRKVFFSKTAREDIDKRSTEADNIWVSDEISQELAEGYEPVEAVIVENQEVD